MLTVFHRTSQAAAVQILRGGFRDTTARYLTDREWSGVWVSDRPLDNSEGASGEALLQIEIAEGDLAPFEWIKAGKTYREWLVPAAVLNEAGTVKPADAENW
jgi:hypothetical protein